MDPNDVDGYHAKVREKLARERRTDSVWDTLEPARQFTSALAAENYSLRMAPAPRLAPPTTRDSYNPPEEFLEDGT